MVKGLDTFKRYFEDFTNHYVIIGGTACSEQFDEKGFAFRATKDIDMILIVEALAPTFVAQFWRFVEEGRYNQTEVEATQRKYYRFLKPEDSRFPVQLELFARRPDVITEKPGMHLTPIPVEGELESLSAIIMDETYYRFTLDHSQVQGGLRMAGEAALIALKARAYLDMQGRIQAGENVDSRLLKKHRNDVIRLAAILDSEQDVACPESIGRDLAAFLNRLTQENPDVGDVLKEMGLRGVTLDDITDAVRGAFALPG